MQRFNRLTLVTFITSISLLWTGRLLWLRFRPLSAPPLNQARELLVASAVPYSLAIPDLGLNLRLFPATASGFWWDYTSDGVSYLTGRPRPGEVGNAVIYGHNWPNLLGNLSRLTPGAKIIVLYSNGFQTDFIVRSLNEVDPQDVSILKPTSDTRLTLYTCSGWWDSRRLVVNAIRP